MYGLLITFSLFMLDDRLHHVLVLDVHLVSGAVKDKKYLRRIEGSDWGLSGACEDW